MSEAFEIARWVVGVPAAAFGGFVSIGNWITLANVIITKGSTSFIPLIGGVLAAMGMVILPVEGLWKWAWIPLVADFGTAPMWIWVGFAKLLGHPKPEKQTNAESGPRE